MEKNNSYISLFSSAGIGCHGFKTNGFFCVATNELLEKRINIQKNNNTCDSEERYVQGSIENSDVKKSIFKLYEEYHKVHGDLNFLIATPPCQGISVANHSKKPTDKKRNSLVVESIQITKKIKPKIFLYENVRGFLNTLCDDIDGYEKKINTAIFESLEEDYIIKTRIINFKNYGVPSSRTRCLVLGVRKDIKGIHPNLLFPKRRPQISLSDTIGSFNSLQTMGEFDSGDFLHNFKAYDKKMLAWIENLQEGQSAFDNIEEERIPHSIDENGKRVLNKNKNSDKYKRQRWDKPGPCIHTRNDTFSSQNTIHPKDNRVFSIRELMNLMTIPRDFNWFNISLNEQISLNKNEKKELLKKNEMTIRHCIGEAVPTKIFQSISKNYLDIKKENIFSVFDVFQMKTIFDVLESCINKSDKVKIIQGDKLITSLVRSLDIEVELDEEKTNFTTEEHTLQNENPNKADVLIINNFVRENLSYVLKHLNLFKRILIVGYEIEINSLSNDLIFIEKKEIHKYVYAIVNPKKQLQLW